MKFKAIITELKQKRTASQDNEFSLKLVTEDNQIMALSAFPSDTVFEVDISPEGELQSHDIIREEERI